MKPLPVTKASISIQVDIDVEFDSFSGKEPWDVAVALQDEIPDLLFEVSPLVVGVLTSVKSATLIEN
jgi:hypothetical protein